MFFVVVVFLIAKVGKICNVSMKKSSVISRND